MQSYKTKQTGQTLEQAGYSMWSQVNENPEELKTRHCGAISRTGFLEMTRCDHIAMFLCEKSININLTND